MKLFPKIVATAALLAGALCPAVAPATWQSAGVLKVPQHHYTFMSVTPQGDLLAATFHSYGGGAREMPAVLIKNPTSDAPQLIELSRVSFSNSRGYGGIAADPSGAYFVSADTGDRAGSFIQKFTADARPDTTFGQNSYVRPNRRTMGIEVVGKFLAVAVDWGEVLILDTTTGQLVGAVPQQAKDVFVRDITVDPKSLRIFGVAQGGVQMWGGGTPWALQGYRWVPFSPPAGQPVAGEGVSIDPILRCILVTPHPGNELHEIFGNRGVRRTVVATAQADSHLCDTALSFDGTTLFISDMRLLQIHLLKRPFPQSTNPPPISSGAGTNSVASSDAPTVAAPTWHPSFDQAQLKARAEQKPMLVYFRRPGFKGCDEFEKNVLLTNQFNAHAAGFVCVFEDAVKNRLLAYKLGVVRVPHVMILDKNGETKAEFSFNIPADQLFAAMDAHRP
jgi:hypothetical protein